MTDRAAAVPALAETFREHGFEGTSLAQLSAATGLGKGSLYNFFPGGKEEMAEAVLADVTAWFTASVFEPLERAAAGDAQAIDAMLDDVTNYFQSGQRICLQGAFALGRERDRFSDRINGYFEQWIASLATALRALGHDEQQARAAAVETVAAIQGAIILSRALGQPDTFRQVIDRQRARLTTVACPDPASASPPSSDRPEGRVHDQHRR
jgi:TetR/AcrR family transcriptional regulator, lmrAB and yxaGH operons repressor